MHHEHALRVGVLHGLVDRGLLGGKALAEAHVDDLRAVVDRVADGVRDVLVALVTVGDGPDHHDLDVRRDAVDAALRAANAADDAGHVRAVARVGAHHVAVAVPALRRVRVVVAHERPRIVRRVEPVFRLRLDLLLRVLELLRRDPGVGESKPHHLGLLRLRARRLVRRHLRFRQRIADRAAQDLVRPIHDHRDLLHLLRELLILGTLLLELVRRSLAGGRVRHGKLCGRRAFRRLGAPGVETRDLERVVLDLFPVLSADEIPAVDVIGVPVVVVVAAVAGDLLGVRPEVGLEADVRGVDPAVDHGDEHGPFRLLAREELALGAARTDADDAVGADVEQLPVSRRFGEGCRGSRRCRGWLRRGWRARRWRGSRGLVLGRGSAGGARSERQGKEEAE